MPRMPWLAKGMCSGPTGICRGCATGGAGVLPGPPPPAALARPLCCRPLNTTPQQVLQPAEGRRRRAQALRHAAGALLLDPQGPQPAGAGRVLQRCGAPWGCVNIPACGLVRRRRFPAHAGTMPPTLLRPGGCPQASATSFSTASAAGWTAAGRTGAPCGASRTTAPLSRCSRREVGARCTRWRRQWRTA